MAIIKNPARAYRNARKAFKEWNTGRKDPNDTGIGTLLRTSTKTGGAGAAVALALGWLSENYPALEPWLSDPQVVAGITAAIMVTVARFSKDPDSPSKL